MQDNFRPWAFWRRFFYGGGFVLFWVGVVAFFVLSNVAPATCFDGEQNGSETGTDCGGACVRICAAEVLPPQVAWAEAFLVAPGQYNAVAYVENRNPVAGTANLAYTFVFYDAAGEVVTERGGVAPLPADSTIPLFEGRVFTDGREIVRTELQLEPAELWVPATSDMSQFTTLDADLQNADVAPRLDVSLQNNSLTAVADIEVVATIFNDAGQPVTASRTFVERIAARSAVDTVFTWPNSIATTVRSCTIPTDVLLAIDLSGSMNNDGGVPVQPLSDALLAARTFVDTLGVQDQVGVVTFATTASTVRTLTGQHARVAAAISGLAIDPAEEAGFTNTAAAIAQSAAELSSDRHSPDARRALVLLTDGLPTAAGSADAEQAAIVAARQLTQTGADVYVIGLGAAVDQSFITTLASSPTQAYLAPSRTDLAQIYASITDALCDGGPTKIEVIAKPPVTFAPLQ